MVEGGEIGGYGGGSLEPPRWWLGPQWLGLTLWGAELPRAAGGALWRCKSRAEAPPMDDGQGNRGDNQVTWGSLTMLLGRRWSMLWRCASAVW